MLIITKIRSITDLGRVTFGPFTVHQLCLFTTLYASYGIMVLGQVRATKISKIKHIISVILRDSLLFSDDFVVKKMFSRQFSPKIVLIESLLLPDLVP